MNKLFENPDCNVEKYDFQLPERKDNEIRLIYCGTLCDEENTLEIMDEFQKIHAERPEVVLKIVYDKIEGGRKFIKKVTNYIQNGVDGITFKRKLSIKDCCYEIATSDIGICWRKDNNKEISAKVKDYEMYGLFLINNITYLYEKKYVVKNRRLCINDTYYIRKEDYINPLDDILNENSTKTFQHKPTVNIKFKSEFKQFTNEKISNEFIYDFTYQTIQTNVLIKIDLFKNVFYKVGLNEQCRVYLYNQNDTNTNIYRNCLHGDDVYFTVKFDGTYYLKISTIKNIDISILNFISINYLCDDDVYMLNLNDQKENFEINSLCLNKIGIRVNRFDAINGNDHKYDDLWYNYINAPLSEGEIKLGRKYLKRGALGYLLSMEKIFSNTKGKYVCIFDDDILIKKNLTLGEMTTNLVKLSNFNIIKLGSSQWDFNNVNTSNYFYYPTNLSNGSFACIYNSNTYEQILKKIRLFNEPFDFEPIRQFNNNKLYIINPNIMIACLDHVSNITRVSRINDYTRFKWDTQKYIKLPYINRQKHLVKNDNETNKIHFLFGITTFSRTTYLDSCILSLLTTLNERYFFTIFISKGLDLNDSENLEFEQYLIEKIKGYNNVNLIINYSYLHYIYYSSNYILKYAKTRNFNFGFILNDDIIFNRDWYMQYYETSRKNNIEHLCWLNNTNDTVIDTNTNLKHRGSVLKANGVLLTFTKNIIEKVGLFNESDFKVRGQSHIEWSLRCCNNGFNHKDTFFDIINSNDLIKLNTVDYASATSTSHFLDKVIHFVDTYELKRRNNLITSLVI